MKGGGKRKTWLSDGSVMNGKQVRSNRRRAPRMRPYTDVYDNPRGALAARDFLHEHRFFKVPVRIADGKKTIMHV
jgi:hypothetical protein